MALMEWNEDLATRHAKIDEQHQALFACINHLHEATEQGRGREDVRNTLMFLTNYTLQHFKMEEDLMDEVNYPEAMRHKGLHHGLVVRLSELMKTYIMLGPGALTMTTMDFLAGWLVEHIQGEDFRLAEFLRSGT
jgi:hemerythrin